MASRIRGRKLQAIRAEQLYREPLCCRCVERHNRVTAATQVDHIVPLALGGDDVPANRQSLCDECHSEKTAEDFGYAKRRRVGLDGWPCD